MCLPLKNTIITDVFLGSVFKKKKWSYKGLCRKKILFYLNCQLLQHTLNQRPRLKHKWVFCLFAFGFFFCFNYVFYAFEIYNELCVLGLKISVVGRSLCILAELMNKRETRPVDLTGYYLNFSCVPSLMTPL